MEKLLEKERVEVPEVLGVRVLDPYHSGEAAVVGGTVADKDAGLSRKFYEASLFSKSLRMALFTASQGRTKHASDLDIMKSDTMHHYASKAKSSGSQ